MYKWSLLLLASVAVFQPIASFTERNLVDGRQHCCDHQPHFLDRDTRLAVYDRHRLYKAASDNRRLNDQRDVPAIRRYLVRSVESALSRETESPVFQKEIAGRSARLSRFDRQEVVEIGSRNQRSRQSSRDRLSWVSSQRERDYRNSQSRISRDDAARVVNDQRSRVSMDNRREQNLLTREPTNMRDNRAIREGRGLLQRTRNDVVQANIRNKRIFRETEFLNRRNYVVQPESNMKDNNRETRSLKRQVRDVSEARLSLGRSRKFNENRLIKKGDRARQINLNRRVTKESFDEEKRVHESLESRRDTNSHRVTRIVSKRGQTRDDFRPERIANVARRFANTAEREVRMRTRSESAERSEKRQSRRIHENRRGFLNNARNSQQSYVEVNRRLIRSVDRSFTRDADIERRQMARFLNRRSNLALSTSETRSHESRDMIRNEGRRIRIQNIRDSVRDARETEQRSLNQQTRDERRSVLTNRLYDEIQKSSVDRVMGRRDYRTSRDADVRSRNMERRVRSITENERRFKYQNTRTDVRRHSRNDEQARHEYHWTSDRSMERSRHEAREVTLARQARSVENVRPTERRDTRLISRVDTRNQKSSNRFNERSEVRKSKELETDASRTRDSRINDKRIQTRRITEERNRHTTADSRDTSETRSRLIWAETERFRHEIVSKKTTEQETFALNWQYLFYTLQAIYLLGVIATVMKENPDSHKTRSWWGIPTKAVKVD